ncbi:MAG: hypothetical protein EOP51_10620 [Sphingobacteriales bacterium]|nr:MAG: hypothetical protein EOP51_10620 [Sphingobacteriales bacterium]
MRYPQLRYILFLIVVCLVTGCANVVPPEGGKKDTRPPKLVSIKPVDSQLNARVTRIEMHFDEYVELANASTEVTMSPLLPIPLNITNVGKQVIVKIPDSLLKENTTYRLSFNSAIKDLHEGNVFNGYTYSFSTGNYFDSLNIKGQTINASTGLPDSGAFILLYDAAESDSIVVRKKPLYIAKAQNDGSFSFAGLPASRFHMFALKDANNNLIYDGGEEKIAFIDSIVIPTDSITHIDTLKLFKEIPDTTRLVRRDSTNASDTDSVAITATSDRGGVVGGKRARRKSIGANEGFAYTVIVDTADIRRRTADITKPLSVSFNRYADTINDSRISLAYDSLDTQVEVPFTFTEDSTDETNFLIATRWKENTLYTLKLLKGFARDSAGRDAMPSKHVFRTKSDDDYSKLHVHLPSRFNSKDYVLVVQNDADTVYQQAVTDTMVHLVRLLPGNYQMRIIVDKNHNGIWDTGDLFARKQPEVIIPFRETMQLKAGWDNTIDYFLEAAPAGRNASPGKRDKP